MYVSFTEKKGVLLCFIVPGSSLYIRKTILSSFVHQVLSCYQKKTNESFCLAHLRAYEDCSKLLAETMEENFLITSTIFPFISLER